MLILAIETSCDETALALVEFAAKDAKGTKRRREAKERSRATKESTRDFLKELPKIKILVNKVASQTKIHAPFGGVVPMLAAREHEKNLEILMKALIKESSEKQKLSEPISNVDLIVVTQGPGLMPCLLVGAAFAKALAYKHKKPLLGVNHLEGHLYSGLLNSEIAITGPRLIFPALALIVSGGHTELVFIKKIGHFQLLGETLDDAAGEAFDKVARLLGLGYPGGGALEKAAQNGNAQAFSFPRPMSRADNYNFSFAGLKTAVLYTLRDIKNARGRRDKQDKTRENKASDFRPQDSNLVFDIAASFQEAIIDSLIIKTRKALENYPVQSLLTGGGVLANQKLRRALEKLCLKKQVSLLMPPLEYCGDNATMIALAGYFNFKEHTQHNWKFLKVDPNLNL